MTRKTKNILLVIAVFLFVGGGIFGGYYFSWRQERVKCFNLIQERSRNDCEAYRNLEEKSAECVKNNDLNCIDFLNYKFLYYLLVKKEKNEITSKICQDVFLATKGDVPESEIKNRDTFCEDYSSILLARDEQGCDTVFEDEFSRNYCRFIITADKNYCQGDERKCNNRAIIFRAFLDNNFDSCDNILDVNTRTACFFFKKFGQKELFSCEGIFTDINEFFKNNLDEIYCKNLN